MSPSLKAQTSVSYPVGTGPIGVVFDGANIWAANYIGGTVTKLLASTGATMGTYPVAAGPSGVVFDGANIWVSNNSGNTVTKLLASTGAAVGTYPVGSNPEGVAFDGKNIWVASYTGYTVTKLLASTGTPLGTYPVGRQPIGVVFDGANIWVANSGSGTVTKLLASTGATVGTYPVGSNPEGLAFDGSNIWVTNELGGTVTKLLASTGATVGTYAVGSEPDGAAFDGANIWVANIGDNTVTELLASTGATVGTYRVGTHPIGVVFDGANIWVTNFDSNTVTKISPPPPSILPAGIVPLFSTSSTIQPGEWISIYGANLASGTAVWTGNFPNSLGGTSVKIDGRAAYLSLVSPGQINLQAPDDPATGTVPVVVTTTAGSTTSTVTLGEFGPSFSLFDATHVAGIILRLNGSGAYDGGSYDILGPTRTTFGYPYPAVAATAGDIVELFGVGFGPTTPIVLAGQKFSGAAPAMNAVNLLIDNVSVTPSFAGLSSAGLFQINLAIPTGLGTGDVPIIATVGGVQTQSGVVISLASPPPTGLGGYWTFAAQSSVYGFTSEASGQLTQSGNNLSGQLSLSGTPCASSAVLSGTVSGNSLSITLNESGQLVTFSGTVSSF